MYEGITIIVIIIGIVCVVLSFFLKDEGMIKEEQQTDQSIRNEEYEARVLEVNQKILELHDFGEFIKKQMDEKHQELLFLYQLIGEKTKEFSHMLEKASEDQVVQPTASEEADINNSDTIIDVDEADMLSEQNQNKRILQLSQQGYGVNDIAKKLGIGQGEVSLVLNLFE